MSEEIEKPEVEEEEKEEEKTEVEEEEKKEEEEEEDEEKTLLESETKKTASEVASFLRKLSNMIEKRIITLKHGEKVLTLALPENITLEIEVEEEGKGDKVKRSLEIELEWYEGELAEDALEL